MTILTLKQQDRFWSKVLVGDGCWEWTGRLDYKGYAVTRGHRTAYQLLVGPIPDGMTIDHLCRNRRCVKPSHLEVVTSRENTMRGHGPTAINARKTHCIRDHEFTEENTYIDADGARHCRQCVLVRRRNRRGDLSTREDATASRRAA